MIMRRSVPCAGTRRHKEVLLGIEHELLRYALWSTWACGLPSLMAARHAGQGGILSFHRVLPRTSRTFATQAVPVTPEKFRRIIQTLTRKGYRFLSMSGLMDWLEEPTGPGKFVRSEEPTSEL